jgi:hypothetical protein
MAGSDRRLVKEINAAGLVEVLAIELRGGVGCRLGYDSVVVAVEQIYFLAFEIAKRIDVTG